MRAYLSAAALGAAVITWLLSGLGRDGASEARDAPIDLRRGVSETGSGPKEAALTPSPEGVPPRRTVRIVYPPPYETR